MAWRFSSIFKQIQGIEFVFEDGFENFRKFQICMCLLALKTIAFSSVWPSFPGLEGVVLPCFQRLFEGVSLPFSFLFGWPSKQVNKANNSRVCDVSCFSSHLRISKSQDLQKYMNILILSEFLS